MAILDQMVGIRREQNFCLQKQKACFRGIEESQLDQMKSLHEQEKDALRDGAIWHGINALLSLVTIASGAFPQKGNASRILAGIGATGDKSASFVSKLYENDTSRIHGILEELRKVMEDLKQNSGDLSHNQQQMLQTLNQAIQEAEKALSAPFDKA